MIAYVLLALCNGGLGLDYWRFCFPAFLLGSAGAIMSYVAST